MFLIHGPCLKVVKCTYIIAWEKDIKLNEISKFNNNGASSEEI